MELANVFVSTVFIAAVAQMCLDSVIYNQYALLKFFSWIQVYPLLKKFNGSIVKQLDFSKCMVFFVFYIYVFHYSYSSRFRLTELSRLNNLQLRPLRHERQVFAT